MVQKADHYRGAPPPPPIISTFRRRRADPQPAANDETKPLTYECDVEAEEECAEQIKVCIPGYYSPLLKECYLILIIILYKRVFV